MSEDTTQAVVDETKATAQPVAAVDGARETTDDLEALLSQFETAAPRATEQPQPEPKAGTETENASREILAARDEIRQQLYKRDMQATITEIRGDLPSDYFDDTFVRAWLDAKAEQDPRLQQAWVNRHNNPQEFKRITGALGRDFAKRYGKLPDKEATETREAVTAAVRGSSTKAPEGSPPDFSKMSDAEFAAAKEKLMG